MRNKWRLVHGNELYDLRTDPSQKTNVADQQPEVLKQLRGDYEKWWGEVEPLLNDPVPIVIGAKEENPVTLSAAVVGELGLNLVASGTLNYYLAPFGFGNFSFLSHSSTAIPLLSIITVWWGFGFAVLVLLAGLHGIPSHLYEAAQVDGAGPVRTVFRITLPLLRPTLLFVLIVLTIAHLQVFAQMFIITQGGPGYSSLSIVMYLFQNAWQFYDMSYASAIAVVLTILMALFSAALFRLLGQRFEF